MSDNVDCRTVRRPMAQHVTRLLIPHDTALSFHEWILDPRRPELVKMDRLGRHNPNIIGGNEVDGRGWRKYVCNHPHCPATAFVRASDERDALDRSFPVPDSTS